MVRDVWPYLAAGLALTLLLALTVSAPAAAAAALVTAAVASFFRDPRRRIPQDPALILSPADGRVVKIAPGREGAPDAGRCVSIFLSVFNVHVNRSPARGTISSIRYTPGSFLPAFRDKASDLNEQNLLVLDTERGVLQVKQIAGLIARRIRCYKRAGEPVGQGEKIGFITFGSRVDLMVPAEAELRVTVGDRVKGGTSIIAVYGGIPPVRSADSVEEGRRA
ncbi:MAG TPA: phosphatidylserine decarboxylase [Patescibacteria group bacterium]|nr:phosphatidylserine decarboxylase [Patescibacteria group bacterium]